MIKAKAKTDYTVLEINAVAMIIVPSEDKDTEVDTFIDQFKGDDLEVWKIREDGFLFVYCNRMKFGYWVHPELIALGETE